MASWSIPSQAHLHGESKTASVGSISRVPATDIESIIVKSLNEHLIAQKEKPASSLTHVRDYVFDALFVQFREAKDNFTNWTMPLRPMAHGGMSLAQLADLNAAIEGKITWAEYFRKWGGGNGPSL